MPPRIQGSHRWWSWWTTWATVRESGLRRFAEGQCATYLTVDVPKWIKETSRSRRHHEWAVGGLSNGGTCALTLAVDYPDIYRTFVSISGEDEIILGITKRPSLSFSVGLRQPSTRWIR